MIKIFDQRNLEWPQRVIRSFIAALFGTLVLVPHGLSQSIDSDDETIISSEHIPDEIKVVLGAVMTLMRGDPDEQLVAPYVISENAVNGVQNLPFNLAPFTMIGSMVTNWGIRETDPPAINLDVFLNFADPLGRRATLSVVIDYMITQSTLEILDVSVAAIAPQAPEVRFFFIPSRTVPSDVFSHHPMIQDLHILIKENALDFETQQKKQRQSFYVLAYVVDLLGQNDVVNLKVTTKSGDEVRKADQSATFSYDGWAVAIIKTAFAFNEGDELVFQAVYQVGHDTHNVELMAPRVIGEVSSYN